MVKRTIKKSLKQQQSKKRKIFLFLFSLIVFSFLSVFVFKFFVSIRKSLWDGKSRFTLVISVDPVIITSFNPEDKSLSNLLLPEKTFIETIHGYGPCRAEAIYRLGELNHQGANLLSGSLESYFGLPIDAYVFNHKIDNSYSYQSASDFKKFLDKKLSLASKKETNLTAWDLIRLRWINRQVRIDKIEIIDLAQTRAIEQISMPDGSLAVKIDSQRLELVIGQYFADGQIKKEDLTIAVLNGTKHSGLANKLANLIKNIGGRVIRVGEVDLTESPDDFDDVKCVIKTAKKYKNYYTVQKLINIFDCQWEGDETINERSSVVIIVGDKYWRMLTLP